MKTLRKHLPYIKNTFTYKYNNGRIEGINNKIKVLSRVAYGYRNFSNFRNFSNYKNQIILHFNMKPKKQPQEQLEKKETGSMAA